MNIIDSLNKKYDLIHGKGVSDESIAAAEKALNLIFADEYRKYLGTYSRVVYDGHELTGVSKDARTHVVDVTLEIKNNEETIPKEWYVIEETGVDGIVIWQDAEGNIYQNERKICSSLAEYVDKY